MLELLIILILRSKLFITERVLSVLLPSEMIPQFYLEGNFEKLYLYSPDDMFLFISNWNYNRHHRLFEIFIVSILL